MREITNVSNVTDAFGAVVYSNEVSTLIVQNAISLEYIRSEFCCDRPCRSRCDPSPCCFWVSCLAVLCGSCGCNRAVAAAARASAAGSIRKVLTITARFNAAHLYRVGKADETQALRPQIEKRHRKFPMPFPFFRQSAEGEIELKQHSPPYCFCKRSNL